MEVRRSHTTESDRLVPEVSEVRNSRFFRSPPRLAVAALAALAFCGQVSVCTSQDASPGAATATPAADPAEQPSRGMPVPTPYISSEPAPAVPVSEASGFVTPVPVAADPAPSDPVAADPATPDPATPDPVTPDFVMPDLTKPDPVAADPEASDPGAAVPATPDPAASDPGAAVPATPDPGAADFVMPDLTKPDPAEAAAGQTVPEETTPQESLPDSPEVGGLTDEELSELLDMLPPEAGPRTYDASAELKFSFRHAPWESVLEWFAEQAGLSLVQIEGVPLGTFNYSDDRVFTPREALDLMNSILELKGHTLIRRQRMLILHNLEDPFPEYMVSAVSAEELQERGEYELVKFLFQLDKITPEEAEQEIQKLLGPQGSIILFAKSRQIQVRDTAGRLRTMERVIRRLEDPEGLDEEIIQAYLPQTVLPEEIIAVLPQLMDIDEENNAARDGSFRYAIDARGMGLLIWAKDEEALERLMKTIEAIDPPPEEASGPPEFEDTLQLIVYALGRIDAETALKVMQTLFAEETATGLRLDVDTGTDNLIAYATPDQHVRIKATLEYMQAGADKKIKIFHLRRVDSQLAKIAVEAMYEISGGDEEADPNLPVVEYDSTLDQLFVRASEVQLADIAELLIQMGEDPEGEGRSSSQERVRFIPYATSDSDTLMQQIEQFWPTMANPLLRMEQPDEIEWLFPGQPTPFEDPARDLLDLLREGALLKVPGLDQPGVNPPTEVVPQNWLPVPAAGQEPARKAVPSASPVMPTAKVGGSPFVLVSQAASAEPAEPTGGVEPAPAAESAPADPASAAELPPIRIFVTPEGLIVTCDDAEALDAFEELLDFLSASYSTTSTKTVVFGLVHTKAVAVSQILDQVLGGGTLTSPSGGGGSLMGDLTSAALGDVGGGIMNSLLGFGGGGSFTPTGSLRITADSRLNALIVEANSTDIQMIEGLLKILDRDKPPQDVLAKSKVQRIPLYNIRAADVIEVVKELYQDRLVTKAGAGGGGQADAGRMIAEAMQRMRGGPGGGRGGRGGQTAEEVEKMSITVDPRSNALLVNAPDALFQEVKLAVEALDQAALDSRQSMVVYTLNKTNPAVLQQALSALVGDSVQFNGSGGSGGSKASSPGQPSPATPSPGQSSDDMRRRMEFFRAMQQRGGGGGPPGSGGRPSFGGRPSSGGPRPSPGGGRPPGR